MARLGQQFCAGSRLPVPATRILTMLKVHKDAIAEIKSAQQRVQKAKEEHDKLKIKLKKAQSRLATEKDRLRKSQEKLES
jgi:aminoglycoside phosphotransferase